MISAGWIIRIEPPLDDGFEYAEVEREVNSLVQQFYHPKLSLVDFLAEYKYLRDKMNRISLRRFDSSKFVFSIQNFKRMQMILNSQGRSFEYFDDFLPFKTPIEEAKRQLTPKEPEDMSTLGILKSLIPFSRQRKQSQEVIEKATDASHKIFEAINDLVKSIEFNHILQIPADFHIEIGVFLMHVWLVCHRLKQLEDSELIMILLNRIEEAINQQIIERVHSIHIRSPSTLQFRMEKYYVSLFLSLKKHFSVAPSSTNTLLQLDALVYSLIYQERVERYSDRVYLLASYLNENFKAINATSLEEILAGNLPFSVFKIPVDYKEQLVLTNPPLSKEEFEAELNSSSSKKKYKYSISELAPDMDSFKMDEDVKISISDRSLTSISKKLSEKFISGVKNVGMKVAYLDKKYSRRLLMDIFEEKAQRTEKEKKKKENFAWKVDSELLSDDYALVEKKDALQKLRKHIKMIEEKEEQI